MTQELKETMKRRSNLVWIIEICYSLIRSLETALGLLILGVQQYLLPSPALTESS